MAARTGAEYVDGLRSDGREVWLGGERVQDVTAHPAFKGSLQGIAGFFDWQHRHAADCIIADPVSNRSHRHQPPHPAQRRRSVSGATAASNGWRATAQACWAARPTT